MMVYSNIELFRIYSGVTFAFLYDSFPLDRKITPGELIEHCGLVTDSESYRQHEQLIIASFEWLIKVEYLSYNQQTHGYSLTVRSFDSLTIVQDEGTNICRGDRLRQLSKEVANASVAESIAEVVTQTLNSGARAALSLFV